MKTRKTKSAKTTDATGTKKKPSKAKRASAPKPQAAAGEATAAAGGEAATGSEEAYLRFLDEARKLDARDVLPFRADAALAYHNVVVGRDALAAEIDRIRAELPKFDVGLLRSLPELALGVMFAAAQAANRSGASLGVVQQQLAEARTLRDLLLSNADGLAKAGIFKIADVDKIREGHGPRDTAQDCVSLATMFRTHAEAVRGKTPVTAAQVKRASELGSALLVSLRAPGARRVRRLGPDETTAARDRLWTLLVQGHARFQQAAGWLWGPALEQHVPALQSRVVPPRKKKAKDTPAPAPSTAAGG